MTEIDPQCAMIGIGSAVRIEPRSDAAAVVGETVIALFDAAPFDAALSDATDSAAGVTGA